MLYLIFLFSIIFAGLTWYRPVLAIQLTLFALPAYLIRFKVGVPMTLLEVMILINVVVWVLREGRQILSGVQQRFKKTEARVIEYPFALEMIGVILVSFMAVGVAHWSTEALGVWKAYFFEPILLLIVIYNVIGKATGNLANRLERLLLPLAYSASLVGLLAVYQKLTGNLIDNPLWAAKATRRVVSVFGYPNAVGLYVEPILLMALGLYLQGRAALAPRSRQVLLLVTVALSLFSIIFAKSIGASLGVGAGLIVFSLFSSVKSRRVTSILLLASILVAILVTPLRTTVIKYATLQDFSGNVRRLQWQESIKMLKDGRVVTGAGLSGYQTALAPYHVPGFFFNKNNDPDFQRKIVIFDNKYKAQFWQPLEIYMYPHNIILNFWTELGLFGVIMFAWLFGRTLFLALRMYSKVYNNTNERYILLGTVAALVATVVHGMVDVPYFKNDLSVLFWLMIGIVGMYRLEIEVKE